VANLNAYLPQLQQKHAERVAQSPAWKLMLDELAQYRTMRAKTAISLNFATREVERKQMEAIQADFRMRHKAIDGTDASLADEASSLDDGLNANERSLKSELKQEKDAKKAKDVQLNETAHILFDAIGMIKADPKLASEVLPYGGKFASTAAVTPVQESPLAAPAAQH
jgi:carboxyl-terminal processing protease